MTFSFKYGLVFLGILAIEVLIALFIHDRFVRPFVGDVLVVVLINAFVKTFIDARPIKVATGVLIFAVIVEISQYFNMAVALGIEDYKLARIVFGSTFDLLDILAYLIGFGSILIVEQKRNSTAA